MLRVLVLGALPQKGQKASGLLVTVSDLTGRRGGRKGRRKERGDKEEEEKEEKRRRRGGRKRKEEEGTERG